MKKLSYILTIIATMIFVACSNDDATEGSGNVTKLIVPLELITGQPIVKQTRAIGDPGLSDKLPPTRYVYAWACYTKESSSAVEYQFLDFGEDLGDKYTICWTDETSGESTSKYTNNALQFSLVEGEEGSEGRIYVLSTNKKLTETQVNSIKALSTQASIEDLTLDLSSWTSLELRDVYSSPSGDTNNNGTFTITKGIAESKPVKLYHCAAKVDFKWEVAEALRSTTSVASITCTGLPTTLKVFAPTENPTENNDDTATITTNTGNKWIGREYVYVLQPASNDKKVSYKVNFDVPAGAPAGTTVKTAVTTTTSAAATGIYTTWYRVVAEVKN